jgi:pseudouridine synthase
VKQKAPPQEKTHARRAQSPESDGIRLQRYLALCGLGSRRHCEAIIRTGRVCVNGTVVDRMGVNIQPGADRVELDGQALHPQADRHAYLMLHKPRGYIVTARDQRGRRTAADLVRDAPRRVFAVGRLDLDSEGLLLFTSDGDLAHRLMHPRYRVEKEYLVTVEGQVTSHACRRLRRGVIVDGRPTLPARVRVIERLDNNTILAVVITEGRKRQVREMFRRVGHEVIRLIRVREGALLLGDLPAGTWRSLTDAEVARLRREVGLESP